MFSIRESALQMNYMERYPLAWERLLPTKYAIKTTTTNIASAQPTTSGTISILESPSQLTPKQINEHIIKQILQ